MSGLFRRSSAAILALCIALGLTGCNDDNKSSDTGSSTSGDSSVTSSGTNASGGTPVGGTPVAIPSDKIKREASSKQVSDTVASIKNGTILHAFSWSFKTITESMSDIAYAGYTAIQTSPINECLVGSNGEMQLYGEGRWYYHYQPTDWTIGNYQLGTRAEFIEMCNKAHEYGIKIIVDVVPNHTTPVEDKINQNLINAVGGDDKLFHENGHNNISDYSDRYQSTTGEMGGLPSVNTENPAFQEYFIKFINDCLACGANGFRYDTAKHIGLPDDPKDKKSENNNFWERVINDINNPEDVFNYGEVLQGEGDRIVDYQKAIGATTASAYGGRIRDLIRSSNLDANEVWDFKISCDDPTAVTWVESHDNYINDGSCYDINKQQVIWGWAIIASRANGTPLFFSRPYGSSSSDIWGPMNRIGAAGDEFYKDPVVVAVNHFRTAMVGENEVFSNPQNNFSVLMIERGTKGAVIINSGQSSVNLNTHSLLADGKYVTRVNGKTTEFTVENNVLTGTIGGGEVAVLYNEGYTELAPIPTVSIETDKFILADKAVPIKLIAENADKAVYSINGGNAVAFKNGDTVNVGGSTPGTVTLTLHAENSGGETTMTYYFTVQGDRSVPAGSKIYLKKPDSWGSSINAYVYNESNGSVRQVSEWPGVPCKRESDGTYSYTFSEQWDSALVIFNDGTNQIPFSMEPGWVVIPNKSYSQ